MRRSRCVLAMMMLCLPLLADAQRLEGIVRGPGGNPAAGVVLTARDAAGTVVGNTVTRDDGAYALYLERGGSHRLQAKRVGYSVENIDAPAVPAGTIVPYDIRLAARRVDLPASLPRGAATCDRNARNRRVADALYEEIVAAVTAARFRIGRNDVTGRWVTSQYRIAKRSDDTLRAALRRGQGSLPTPFPPVSPERLEEMGFFASLGGDRTFYAPDLEILTTDWFLQTHCVRLSRVTDDSLVLGFTPLRQRRGLVDVEGEFVVDYPSLDLRSMTFRYVDLPATERESGAGGRLQFTRTAAGGWILSDWSQRTPFLNYFAAEGNTTLIRTAMTRVDVVAHFLVGGRMLAVADSGGTRFQRDPHGVRTAGTRFAPLCPERTTIQPTGAVAGTFTRDSSDAPLSGSVIRASWTIPVIVNRTDLQEREEVRETTTDANGSWWLCDIPVERDVVVRWEVSNTERRVTVKVMQPFSVVDVRQPR
jgi:hypothetical protein